MSIVWLDCTLRDGGYYNQWDFSIQLIEDYLTAMSNIEVDRVEIGFRSVDRSNQGGFSAHSPPSASFFCRIPEDLNLGVMVNVAEFGATFAEVESNLSILFPGARHDFAGFVRIATTAQNIAHAQVCARWLKQRGYEVAVNMMQVSELSFAEMVAVLNELDEQCVDVLYLADSFGAMRPLGFAALAKLVGENWGGDIGIHAHDNRNLAQANTLEAINAGVKWFDSTILGMGRGAGNVRTELMLHEVGALRDTTVSYSKLEPLIKNHFEPLQSSYGWGPHPHYALAARRGIHPTYVQEMVAGSSSYTTEETENMMWGLQESDSKTFKAAIVEGANRWSNFGEQATGTWDQREFFEDRSVLLIGAGASLREHFKAICYWSAGTNMLVLAANFPQNLEGLRVDAHLSCHPLKLANFNFAQIPNGTPLICPRNFLPIDTLSQTESPRVYDLALELATEGTRASVGKVSLSSPSVFAYSVMAALSGGAREVFLAGFDGFNPGDPRFKVEQQLIGETLAIYPNASVTAVTPTRFDLPFESIYAILVGIN